LLSSIEGVKESPSADSELLLQSKGELLLRNEFDELSLVENSFDSEENDILDDRAISYDEMDVDGNESVWKVDSQRDNMGQISVTKEKTEHRHVTHMPVPHEVCRHDSGIDSQDTIEIYHSPKRDLSVEDADLMTNELKMSARRDLSQDLTTKCQQSEDTTRHRIPLSLKYFSQQIPCSAGQKKVDFLCLLGEESDHHTIVKVILSYLEPVDLMTVLVVSKTWNKVCKSDRDAQRRIRSYVDHKKRNKENWHLSPVCRECLAQQYLYCMQS
jgi:hypothetical protein